MTDRDPRIAEANRLMDAGKWEAARWRYRAAFAAVAEFWVPHLRVAEEYERVEYCTALHTPYPPSFRVGETGIRVLAESLPPSRIARLCTERRRQPAPSEYAAQSIRGVRFQAALGRRRRRPSRSYATVVAACVQLWGAQPPLAVIQDLATLNDPAAIPLLETLLQAGPFPPPMEQFVTSKIPELPSLAHLVARSNRDRLGNDSASEPAEKPQPEL